MGGRVAEKIAGMFETSDQELINEIKSVIDKEMMKGLDAFKNEAAKSITSWNKKREIMLKSILNFLRSCIACSGTGVRRATKWRH